MISESATSRFSVTRVISSRPMRRILLACLIACACVATLGAIATDWPQYLGPTRNGEYGGPPLAARWPADGPKKVWQKPVGEGFAGPVVAGNRLILFHRVKNEEIVEALDSRTGESQWRYAYPTSYRDDFGFDEGPRAVPVVASGRVYTFGAEGQLTAIDLTTGQKVWTVDTAAPLQRAQGLLWRSRIAARRERPRHRQYWRQGRKQGRGNRRVRRQHWCRALDSHRSRGQLLVAGQRDRLEASRRRCSSPGMDLSDSIRQRARSDSRNSGDRDRRRRSTRRRRSSSATRSSCRPPTAPGRRPFGSRAINSSSSGLAMRSCRITTRPACTRTATCMDFTAARSSTRASEPSSSKPAR